MKVLWVLEAVSSCKQLVLAQQATIMKSMGFDDADHDGDRAAMSISATKAGVNLRPKRPLHPSPYDSTGSAGSSGNHARGIGSSTAGQTEFESAEEECKAAMKLARGAKVVV
jgi:hypothetical protein